MMWLKDPDKSIVDNVNNVRCEDKTFQEQKERKSES